MVTAEKTFLEKVNLLPAHTFHFQPTIHSLFKHICWLFPTQSDPSIKLFYEDFINFSMATNCDVTKWIMTSVGKVATGAAALFRNKSAISLFCNFFLSRLSKNFPNLEGLILFSLQLMETELNCN